MFSTYLQLGFEHIIDIQGLDHVLFILSLCLSANAKSLKDLLILITAFTIGHSITLAASALDIITVPTSIVENAIPITIIVSCLINIYQEIKNSSSRASYFLVLIFGFIHGMGFSNFFRSILGKEESIIGPLFAFNVGVEVAQASIVSVVFIILLGLSKLFKSLKWINIIGSLMIVAMTVQLILS